MPGPHAYRGKVQVLLLLRKLIQTYALALRTPIRAASAAKGTELSRSDVKRAAAWLRQPCSELVSVRASPRKRAHCKGADAVGFAASRDASELALVLLGFARCRLVGL